MSNQLDIFKILFSYGLYTWFALHDFRRMLFTDVITTLIASRGSPIIFLFTTSSTLWRSDRLVVWGGLYFSKNTFISRGRLWIVTRYSRFSFIRASARLNTYIRRTILEFGLLDLKILNEFIAAKSRFTLSWHAY